MYCRIGILWTLVLAGCASSSDNRLVAIDVGGSEAVARDRSQELYGRQGADYPLFYLDRAAGTLYVYGPARSMSGLGAARTIDARLAPLPIAHRLGCILADSCSSDDDRFCSDSRDVGHLTATGEEEVVRFFRERAYPVTYVQVIRSGGGATQIQVQYYADCASLAADLETAFSTLALR